MYWRCTTIYTYIHNHSSNSPSLTEAIIRPLSWSLSASSLPPSLCPLSLLSLHCCSFQSHPPLHSALPKRNKRVAVTRHCSNPLPLCISLSAPFSILLPICSQRPKTLHLRRKTLQTPEEEHGRGRWWWAARAELEIRPLSEEQEEPCLRPRLRLCPCSAFDFTGSSAFSWPEPVARRPCKKCPLTKLAGPSPYNHLQPAPPTCRSVCCSQVPSPSLLPSSCFVGNLFV